VSGGTFKADLVACGEIAPDLVACLCHISGDLPNGHVDSMIVQTFKEVDGKTVEVHGYAEDAYAWDEALGPAVTLPSARQDPAAPVRA